MDYTQQATAAIDASRLSPAPKSRLAPPAAQLAETDAVFDAHLHVFDIRCINRSYFIIRMLKDMLGLKSVTGEQVEFSVDEEYTRISENEDGWEEALEKLLTDESLELRDAEGGKKGLIDGVKAAKFLTFRQMRSVYDHYIDKFSLAAYFDLPPENVITTALMMDLEPGWETTVRKSVWEQVAELKTLSLNVPTLPFLFCDPRRADYTEPRENLYHLFHEAFCEGQPFFGVKIYPALGYDPSDYRLTPIFELCERFGIPVMTHCGGNIVSSDRAELTVFEGATAVTLTRANRKALADELNDPRRWAPVLDQFPNLRLCFGHFGGFGTWKTNPPPDDASALQQRKETIIDFMRRYPNVYADFSYNHIEIDISQNLTNLLVFDETVRERTLFGTDYWVVNPAANIRKAQARFLDGMKYPPEPDLVNRLTRANPRKFLF